MDLGTTTVVLRLINLETGELVADASFENPQRFGGSDVMSRIHYDTDHRASCCMRTLAGYLTHAIEAFPVDPKSIYEMVVVGNSTMRDLFFRQNVYSIGQTPYRSITEIEMAEGKRTDDGRDADGQAVAAADPPQGPRLRRPDHQRPRRRRRRGVHAGDRHRPRRPARRRHGHRHEHGADRSATRTASSPRSCPAGPAFEGGAIACGMPGLDGAIEDVAIDDATATIQARRDRRRRRRRASAAPGSSI